MAADAAAEPPAAAAAEAAAARPPLQHKPLPAAAAAAAAAAVAAVADAAMAARPMSFVSFSFVSCHSSLYFKSLELLVHGLQPGSAFFGIRDEHTFGEHFIGEGSREAFAGGRQLYSLLEAARDTWLHLFRGALVGECRGLLQARTRRLRHHLRLRPSYTGRWGDGDALLSAESTLHKVLCGCEPLR